MTLTTAASPTEQQMAPICRDAGQVPDVFQYHLSETLSKQAISPVIISPQTRWVHLSVSVMILQTPLSCAWGSPLFITDIKILISYLPVKVTFRKSFPLLIFRYHNNLHKS